MDPTYVNGDEISITVELSGYKIAYKVITIDTVKGSEAGLDFILIGDSPNEAQADSSLNPGYCLGMSIAKRTFWRGINASEAVTLVAAETAQTTSAEHYLTLESGQVAYITDLFVGADGLTDGVILSLAKNSKDDGTGTSIGVTKDVTGNGDEMGRHFPLQCPIRVPYEGKCFTINYNENYWNWNNR